MQSALLVVGNASVPFVSRALHLMVAGFVFFVMFGLNGRLPEVLWDGYVARDRLVNGRLPPDRAICIDNGAIGVMNVDGPNKYRKPSTDTKPYRCTLPKLPAVELPSTETAVASTATPKA